MALVLEHLPADVLGLSEQAGQALAERPHPRGLGGMTLPNDLAQWSLPAERFAPDERAELAGLLEENLAAYEPHVAVLDAARRVAEPGAQLVLCGQQPGFFGGPLYNLFKALHAVRLARALQEAWGVPVVPVFWNHADDHDIAEVHHLWIQNPNMDLRKIGLAGVSSGRVPLSRFVFEEERHRLSATRELVRQDLAAGPYVDEAIELFSPREGESFAGAFSRSLLGLLGHLGLVVLEPDWIRPNLSRALANIVTHDVVANLEAASVSLRSSGAEPAIDPRTAALVFRLIDGKRSALRFASDGFRFDGEPGSRTPVELAAEIVQAPLEFSPGALLRPLARDAVLPVAAWIGGWGELAYHAQLGELRRALDLPQTPFVPRQSATLVDPETHASMNRLGLTVREVLSARGELSGSDASPPPSVVGGLRRAGEEAGAVLLELKDDLARLDKGLAVQLKKTAAQMRDLADKLASKAERVHANASGKGRRHQRRIANGLFPRGVPQERVRGTLEFVAGHGRGWIDDLLAELEPLPTEHLVAYLKSGKDPLKGYLS